MNIEAALLKLKPWRHFKPFETLACALFQVLPPQGNDGAHDVSHILRVWENVKTLSAQEGGDLQILAAACILHDCVSVEKDSDRRSHASRMAATRAEAILDALDWPQNRIDQVAHAIEAHSFSAGIVPATTEARVLQDADRLDAIGHIGIARCFYVSGRMGRPFYDPDDPQAERRDLNDTLYAIDHFYTKLLRLAGSFQTETGNRLAAERHAVTRAFLDGFLEQVKGEVPRH
jgi:uncharacterized protein